PGRMALPRHARAARISPARRGGRERSAQRALQSTDADADPEGGPCVPGIHAVDGGLRRRQPHADGTTGVAVLRALAPDERHADRAARGGAPHHPAAVSAVLGTTLRWLARHTLPLAPGMGAR